MKVILIGITDNPKPWFPPEVEAIIRSGRIFSGGRRHHDLMAPFLPAGHEWIDITAPVEKVVEKYRALSRWPEACTQTSAAAQLTPPSREGAGVGVLMIFASGDPLFYGFANTLRRLMPEAALQVFPTFNSLQMLAHRLVMPYHDMRVVSLTGRPWHAFDRALIEGVPKMGVLTDREHTPAAIARRMLDYGYDAYQLHVGEHLGHPEKEKVTTLTLEEAAGKTFTMPNCIILAPRPVPPVAEPAYAWNKEDTELLLPSRMGRGGNRSSFGLPDTSFARLNGREKMITKMPIRLLTLQALDLPCRHVLWDIGACTGSVSIEARRLFPHLKVVAFEVRPECEAIIRENARRHGAPGIELHIGDFRELDVPAAQGRLAGEEWRMAHPDAVFIGGHGGRLKEIMATALHYLTPDGIIVMNSVTAPKVLTDSRRLWDDACRELGLTQEPALHIQLNTEHPITILKCRR